MAAAAGGGRRRTQSNTTEDNALNMIAREAEARLAAKRAARAEARSIRMKELERMQREADEKMDKEYQRSLLNEEAIKKRIQSHLTTTTTAPPPQEVEVNGPVVPENQLKSLQDNVQDLELKYRSTMVNIAQLDNERQALSYQVDCLKEKLEDEEEVAENLRVELAQRSKEYNKLSYENKKNLDEIERLQLMLAERDRILEEHSINIEEELMGVTSPDGLSPRTAESVNLNESVEIDHSGRSIEDSYGSSGGLKSRGSSRRSSVPDDKEILLEQIRSLKEEVSELRRENETETSRMKDVAIEEIRTSSWESPVAEGGHPDANDLECSTFVDVSGEAEEIDDEPPVGSVINNNEKNEDFEVIDNNLHPPGGLSNFEDKSYEGVSTTSMNTESLDSLDVTESVESELPLEISMVGTTETNDLVVALEEHQQGESEAASKDSTKEYPDYDIVEDNELKYSTDVEEGVRIRSRYYSVPQDDDEGFETPPESEDDLRKLSASDKPAEVPSSVNIQKDGERLAEVSTDTISESTSGVGSRPTETLPSESDSTTRTKNSDVAHGETPHDPSQAAETVDDAREAGNRNGAKESNEAVEGTGNKEDISESSTPVSSEVKDNPVIESGCRADTDKQQRPDDQLQLEQTGEEISSMQTETVAEPSGTETPSKDSDDPGPCDSKSDNEGCKENGDKVTVTHEVDELETTKDASVSDGQSTAADEKSPTVDSKGHEPVVVLPADSSVEKTTPTESVEGKQEEKEGSPAPVPKKRKKKKGKKGKGKSEDPAKTSANASFDDETAETLPSAKEADTIESTKEADTIESTKEAYAIEGAGTMEEDTNATVRSESVSSDQQASEIKPSESRESFDISCASSDAGKVSQCIESDENSNQSGANLELCGSQDSGAPDQARVSDNPKDEEESDQSGSDSKEKKRKSRKSKKEQKKEGWDAQKLSNDLRLKIQKLEQENARLEGNVLRLETQVKRYRSQAEAAEAVEDTLLAEKRKIARELRQSQEHIMELETEKEHLQKRLDKLRQRRKDDV